MATETVVTETSFAAFEPLPQPPAPARHLPLPWLLPGLVSGGLLWACFFPLGWAPLAWVALVPLLTLVRLEISKKALFFGAYFAGSVYFWSALQWMRVADFRMHACWAILAVYCSLYFPAAIFLIRFLDRRKFLPLVLSVPIVWSGLEYLRSFFLTGFAWYFLGHSQHDYLPLIQIADVTGVYGVTFLIAAVNAWIFTCLWQFAAIRQYLGYKTLATQATSPKLLAVQGACLALLLIGTWAYGAFRLSQEDFEVGPRLSLLQGNHDQRIRNQVHGAGRVAAVRQMLESYETLCERAHHQTAPPDMMVWPETSFPYGWIELPADLNEASPDVLFAGRKLMERLQYYTQLWQATQLYGVNTEAMVPGGKTIRYNSALFFPKGPEKIERYDKLHRVPMGEYVPLIDWLPFLNAISPYDFDYSIHSGDKLTRFALGKFHFGVLVCFEDTDPFLARAYGRDTEDGPPVDFLVNITNDGWFDTTTEHEEHLAISRFRAVETRRALARAVNMGISAVIDSNGRVQKPEWMPLYEKMGYWVVPGPKTPDSKNRTAFGHIQALPVAEWADYKNIEGVLTATIPIDHRASLYVRFGDWLPLGCWFVVACSLIGAGFRRSP